MLVRHSTKYICTRCCSITTSYEVKKEKTLYGVSRCPNCKCPKLMVTCNDKLTKQQALGVLKLQDKIDNYGGPSRLNEVQAMEIRVELAKLGIDESYLN